MMATLDSVAFESLDTRLVRYLHEKSIALNDPHFHITHQQIAQELNSSREAVSRLLKKMENNGSINLGRNNITVIDL